jgi:hypothetical protein
MPQGVLKISSGMPPTAPSSTSSTRSPRQRAPTATPPPRSLRTHRPPVRLTHTLLLSPTRLQQPAKKKNFGMGLGAKLLGGAVGGLLIGDIISDLLVYDGGYDVRFDDSGACLRFLEQRSVMSGDVIPRIRETSSLVLDLTL